MKAIILAAGYATRLYPLTKDFPKPLLPINGRPIVDYIMDKIYEVGIKEVYLVTNHRFVDSFQEWADGKEGVKVIDDGTLSNEDRLGAIADISLVVENEGLDDDIIVFGGDTLITFSLNDMLDMLKKTGKSVLACYDIKDFQKAKALGVIQIGDCGRIISLEEKPEEPKSTICSACTYLYPRGVVPKIKEYLSSGNNPDLPTRFPIWLMAQDELYAIVSEGLCYDVGSFEILKKVKEDFGEVDVDIKRLRLRNF